MPPNTIDRGEFSLIWRDEFTRLCEDALVDPNGLHNFFSQEQSQEILTLIKNIQPNNCGCGTCIDIDYLDTLINNEKFLPFKKEATKYTKEYLTK